MPRKSPPPPFTKLRDEIAALRTRIQALEQFDELPYVVLAIYGIAIIIGFMR